MIAPDFRIRKAEKRLPSIDFFPEQWYGFNKLDIAIFGPGPYAENLKEMGKAHFHSRKRPEVSFMQAPTPVSISTINRGFYNDGKIPDIIDDSLLQLGYIIKVDCGIIHFNGESGSKSEFVSYNDFLNDGTQSCADFACGGLAKLLECPDEEIATKLFLIASKKSSHDNVKIKNFNRTKKSETGICYLSSADDGKLEVGFGDPSLSGYTLGVAYDVIRRK